MVFCYQNFQVFKKTDYRIIYEISQKDYAEISKEQCNGIYEVEDHGTFHCVNGKLHREDGPAEEHINGNKYWFVNDKYHRLDGPAIEYYDGRKLYYIEGKLYLTKEEFDKVAYLYNNGLQDYL